MDKERALTIINVGYRSTNYWVVSAGPSRLLVDIGWPGSLGILKADLQRMGVPLREIKYALVTHYHIHQAGLAENLKREGVLLLVLDVQVHALAAMKAWAKPSDNYLEITDQGSIIIAASESHRLLHDNGIAGEILHTPGHTEHCISLLLDDGAVFTGDLPTEAYAFDNPTALASWRLLRTRGATRIFPAHGPVRSMS